MRKIEMSQNKTLNVEKRIKIGTNRERSIVAAEWFDRELQASVKLRGKKSKAWRVARRNNESREIINKLEEEYKTQQKITSR